MRRISPWRAFLDHEELPRVVPSDCERLAVEREMALSPSDALTIPADRLRALPGDWRSGGRNRKKKPVPE